MNQENPALTVAPDLCIVIPTFNERENIKPLIDRISVALSGVRYEVIFVDDDSPDGTTKGIRDIAQQDPRIRAVRRVGRRGLSSAVVEGCLATSAPYIAVMDCDLQHDERILPEMFDAMRSGEYDLVIGSRSVQGGSLSEMSASRQRISRWASDLARWCLRSKVKDLMSGFFMTRRQLVDEIAPKLTKVGFKILVDIIATSVPLRVMEVPFQFRPRHAGESKLDRQVALEFVLLLIDKTIGKWVPTRLVVFMAVGGSGVIVHFGVLTALFWGLRFSFDQAQVLATLVAMTTNYTINNAFTYHDVRLKGVQWLRGWGFFLLISAFGAIGNVGVAHMLFNASGDWGLSALAGVAIGTIWNFAMTRIYVWRDL